MKIGFRQAEIDIVMHALIQQTKYTKYTNTYDYVIGSMQEYPLDLQAQQVVYNLCERG